MNLERRVLTLPLLLFLSFSDMEFDHAGSYQETHFEIIKREFEAEGYDLPELVRLVSLPSLFSRPLS